ncbi:hypothetical protein LIA77_09736 [Sarocladium implicatum]|nr:hypothetical protein LIA77_09736 [Sarocladium implicatum]
MRTQFVSIFAAFIAVGSAFEPNTGPACTLTCTNRVPSDECPSSHYYGGVKKSCSNTQYGCVDSDLNDCGDAQNRPPLCVVNGPCDAGPRGCLEDKTGAHNGLPAGEYVGHCPDPKKKNTCPACEKACSRNYSVGSRDYEKCLRTICNTGPECTLTCRNRVPIDSCPSSHYVGGVEKRCSKTQYGCVDSDLKDCGETHGRPPLCVVDGPCFAGPNGCLEDKTGKDDGLPAGNGIVVNAAATSVYIFTKDHGWRSFRDGPRLVLILFLAAAALWAQTSFIAMAVDGSEMPGCQLATSFASAFDQIARVSFIQFLLWGIQNGNKTTAQTLIFQGIVFIRFLLGGVVVGTQRPQIDLPYCVAITLVLPLNLAAIVFDSGMAFALLVKVFTQGSFKIVPEGAHSVIRRKVLILGILAFAIWSALSGPMLLGSPALSLVVRTLLPAIGLMVVFGVLGLSRSQLSFAPQRKAAEDQSESFSRPRPQHNRDLGSQDSGYSSERYAPPNRYEEIKGETVVSINAFHNSRPARGLGHSKAPSVGQIGRPQLDQGPADLAFNHQSTFAPSRQAPTPATTVALRTPKSLAKKGGKVQISAPVLIASATDSGPNPLQRIATIDLAEAARQDRARREMAPPSLAPSTSQRIAKAALSPNTLMKNGINVKRKQIAPETDQPVAAEPLLDPAEMVTTTSSQLSPGVEELRRRSPRHPPAGSPPGGSTSSTRSPPSIPERKRSQHAMSALTMSDDVKSRSESTFPLSPPPKSPRRPQPPLSPFGRLAGSDSQKPPVPRLASTKIMNKPGVLAERLQSPPVPPKDTPNIDVRALKGLPKNPRMQAPKPMVQQQKTLKEQTVMLLNDIEYNDPAAVRNIVDTATNKSPAPRVTSIVHRPRPIPRQSEIDRQIFPAEGSPSPKSRHGHKRSLSGGSIVSRKSILRSVPASPSQLPPLPPVPQTATQSDRPLPNNTRSMTFDEKMSMFYPGSQDDSRAKEMRRRSNSVPELPELPAMYKEPPPIRDSSRDSAHQTDKSSRSSVRTASLLNFPEVPSERSKVPTSKFSVDTTVGEGYVWATATKAKLDGAHRRSSPVLPAAVIKSPSNGSELKSQDDDATTIWGSIHSPVERTIMQKALAIEVPPVPKVGPCPALEAQTAIKDETKSVADTDGNRGSEVTMTVVLDTSYRPLPIFKDPATELERVMSADSSPKLWHRRIGDECPTFSGRKDSIKRRKNPPPAPLPLNRTRDRRPRLVPAAEASPLEAPEHALEAIQEQLRKFEDPNRESTGSQELQRMTLLANLEAEMGMHENQWQQMQSRLDRDSFSTTAGSPFKRQSRQESLSVSIVAQADESHEKAGRRNSRPGFRLSQNKHTASIASSRSNQSLENEDEWDEGLAEAQAEYLKHRFQLISHLSDRTTSTLITSPTTHAHRSHGEAKVEPAVHGASGLPRLWQSTQTATATLIDSTPSLWTGDHSSINTSFRVADMPVAPRRPSILASGPVPLESNRLWEKKAKRSSFGPQKGLWVTSQRSRPTSTASTASVSDNTVAASSTPASKPQLARKPSRRSKRVTLLPDILEDPEPMPNKRGTLALYQFPWGEKSDSATIRPRPQMFMAMPGTMTSGRSSHQQPPQAPPAVDPYAFDPENYSASFFDDEDDGDNFPEQNALSDEEDYFDEDEEDSDEFDETTLWEIASLLRSNQVPSRQSLLPEDWRYSAEPTRISYSEPVKISQASASRNFSHEDVIPDSHDDAPVVVAASMTAESAQSALWTSQETNMPAQDNVGLLEPDEQTWEEYKAALPSVVRAPTRASEREEVSSESLWVAKQQAEPVDGMSAMWQPQMPKTASTGLWIQEARGALEMKGVANPTAQQWAVYQVNAHEVARAASRPSQVIATIESTSMWKPTAPAQQAASTGLWSAKPTKAPTQLWSANPPTISVPTAGLEQPSTTAWANYTSTTLTPVRAKPRLDVIPKPESMLASSNLWGAATSPVTEDWISLSTVRARSPSTSSVESAASDSSSASSLKSTTTKASTVASVFSSFFRRKRTVSDAKTEASVPETPEVPALPVVKEIQAPTTAPEAIPELKPIAIAQPKAQAQSVLPLRRQYRPLVAFRADWDAALEEAIRAGTPTPKKVQRPTASRSDWAAALEAAIPQTIVSLPSSNATKLWTSASPKSPFPTTSSLWTSHLSSRCPRAAFPANTSVLPNPSRSARSRSGSLAQQQQQDDGEMSLQILEGLTEQSLWRRSVAMEKAEVRTRDWLSTSD